MGWNKKVKFWANERLDLPDLVKLQKNVYDYLGQINKKQLSPEQMVISGFIVQNNGGTEIKVATKDSVALNTETTTDNLVGNLWIGSGDLSIDPDITQTLNDNATSYIELEFYEEDSAPDTRAFWDPTANSGEGDEYNQIVNICTTIKCRLVVNTTSFSGNVNYIPLAEVTTASGAISTIRDARPLYYRLNSDYAWPDGRTVVSDTDLTGADKSIQSEKEWKDAIMSVIKEVKGVEWYESLGGSVSLSSLLQDRNIILSITGAMDFESPTGTLSWDEFKILVPDSSFDFTVSTGNFAGIADGEVLYVVFDRTGAAPTLATQKVANGSLTLHRDNYVIGTRQGSMFVLRDGRNVFNPWIYSEKVYNSSTVPVDTVVTIPLDSKDSSAERKYRVARDQLSVFMNGVKLNPTPIYIESSFQPSGYTSGTGFVSVPDSVDLSMIKRFDTFKDSAGSVFWIRGGVSNELGAKGFQIATGQTVSLLAGASIYKQDYEEVGTAGDYSKDIKLRTEFKVGSIINYVIQPLPSVVAGFPYNTFAPPAPLALDGGFSIDTFTGEEDGGASADTFTGELDGGDSSL